MNETRQHATDRTRPASAVVAAGFVLLVSITAGAADRVVLGEYFTSLF